LPNFQDSQTLFEVLVESLRKASTHNRDDQTPPVVVLWTDKENQWAPLLPRLSSSLPFLIFDHQHYQPEELRGPAYYIRCLLSGSIPDQRLQKLQVPILYLPGISKQELRAIEECEDDLKPIAELQYRGVLFTQKNGKDWTIPAFLQNREEGIGISVIADQVTRDALKQTLHKLVDVTLSELKNNEPIKDQYLFGLLNPDDVRSVLNWMNDPDGFKKRSTPEEWIAFSGVCKQKYQINPTQDSVITAAEKLGKREGTWNLVWQRFLESPKAYQNIPDLLSRAKPGQVSLFERSESWPQDNEAEEDDLRGGLLELHKCNFQQACVKVKELYEHHAKRRYWVWSNLDKAPLANAIRFLHQAVVFTEIGIFGTISEMAKKYCSEAWQVDNAILDVLSIPYTNEDQEAVEIAVQAIYRPWLESLSNSFQKAIENEITQNTFNNSIPIPESGSCIAFVDALRMDLAHRLINILQSDGYDCQIDNLLTALPPITSTAKPALLDIKTNLSGKGSSSLNPVFSTSQTPLTSESWRKILSENGIQYLAENELGDPSGIAWTEIGEIDAYGHEHSARLPFHVVNEIKEIEKRILALLQFGWKRIILLTDHGWLLLAGGLPKVQLPEHLTEVRKGRCARLKPGSKTDMLSLPWYWDNETQIAYAPGINCFEIGKTYEHGGLSLQECVTPMVTVRKSIENAAQQVQIVSAQWHGLRCSIQLDGLNPGLIVDLRVKAADPATSIAVSVKEPDSGGLVSLVVEDDDRIGMAVFVVVLAPSGQPWAQMLTTVGG
jgi:hypothetical protein